MNVHKKILLCMFTFLLLLLSGWVIFYEFFYMTYDESWEQEALITAITRQAVVEVDPAICLRLQNGPLFWAKNLDYHWKLLQNPIVAHYPRSQCLDQYQSTKKIILN